jgi:hypothetical protein
MRLSDGMIATALALSFFHPIRDCAAQDRPLGDVARETRAQSQSAKPSRTLTSDGPETAVTANDDPLEVITRSSSALLRDSSHRCRQTSSGNSGPGWNKVVTTEFAAGDHVRVIADQGNQPSETIFIGKDGYRKTGNSAWAKIDPLESAWDATYAPNALKLPDELKFGYKSGDLKLVGSEPVGGVATYHYQATVRDVAIDRTIDVWIGAADSLPRKTEMMTHDLQMKTSWHETTECTYGVEIKIEPPM